MAAVVTFPSWGDAELFAGLGCLARTSLMESHGLDAFGQLRIAAAADVHEEDARFIEEEVVVQARHFQAVGEGGVDGGVDFVLKNHSVPHHHGAVLGGRERGPGAEAREGLESQAVDADIDVAPRPGKANHAIGRDGRLRAGSGRNSFRIHLRCFVAGVQARRQDKGEQRDQKNKNRFHCQSPLGETHEVVAAFIVRAEEFRASADSRRTVSRRPRISVVVRKGSRTRELALPWKSLI
ncbi:MAG: hypothetical protein U0793_16195 [Gemmataceae bacterium]